MNYLPAWLILSAACLSPKAWAELPQPFWPVSVLATGTDLRDAPADKVQPPAELSSPKAPSGGGWTKTSSSLLLYDAKGELVNEIGLGRWKEEEGKGLVQRRQMRGNVSADGRFAWHWQKVETLPERSDTPASAMRTLVYLDADGRILWKNDLADAPEGLEPVVQSDDGRTALVCESDLDGWTAVAVNAAGERQMEVRGARRLERLALAPTGRFALVLWSPLTPDTPVVYSFLDVKRKLSKEFPAYTLPPGEVRVDEGGALLAGTKKIFAFP